MSSSSQVVLNGLHYELSLMVLAATEVSVSLLRKRGGQSPGQLFSLSLVYAMDGWSTLPLSKAIQFVQQWWLQCNYEIVSKRYLKVTVI